MSTHDEVCKDLLLDMFQQWIDINKDTIGENWYEKLTKHIAKARHYTPGKAVTLGLVLWIYNVVSTLGVVSVLSKYNLTVLHVDPNLDQRSTRQLLHALQFCFQR